MVMRLVREDDPADLEALTLDDGDGASFSLDTEFDVNPDCMMEDALGDLDESEGAPPDEGDNEQELADGSVAGAATSAGPAVDLSVLEALLLSTHHPLTPARLAELMDLDSTKPLKRAVKELNEQYAAGGRAFRVEQVAGGYQILTLPEFGERVKKLHQREGDARLTKAAIETLAIIAYKQPILRADVEAIRGVACGETIRSLMEKHLVKIAGRAEEPGRPILYGTTKRFLELFGLNSLRDLPQPEALKARAERSAAAAAPQESPSSGSAAGESAVG